MDTALDIMDKCFATFQQVHQEPLDRDVLAILPAIVALDPSLWREGEEAKGAFSF